MLGFVQSFIIINMNDPKRSPKPNKPVHPEEEPGKSTPDIPRKVPNPPGAPDRTPIEIPPHEPKEVPVKEPERSPGKNPPKAV